MLQLMEVCTAYISCIHYFRSNGYFLILQILGSGLSGSDCCYMVVFQYGSIVLFNVRDHEVDGYLKIVEKHSSGLLPEMRKDGECICIEILLINRHTHMYSNPYTCIERMRSYTCIEIQFINHLSLL